MRGAVGAVVVYPWSKTAEAGPAVRWHSPVKAGADMVMAIAAWNAIQTDLEIFVFEYAGYNL